MAEILFYIFASIAIVSGFLVVVAKNLIHSACWLVVSFLAIAAVYILLNAEFIAALQILVYAGAMIVLILFALFVINMDKEEFEIKWHLQTPLAFLFGFALFFEIGVIIKKMVIDDAVKGSAESASTIGNSEAIGNALFTKFLLPFEIASVLLLAALIGAVVIAKKQKEKKI